MGSGNVRTGPTPPGIVIVAVLVASIGTAAGGAALKVAPVTALIDRAVSIEVSGCAAGQTVVLRAVCFDDRGLRWESRATFEADPEGAVDLTKMAPRNGAYEGVDPMGLFWSMINDEGTGSRTAFASDELDPIEVVLQLEIDGEVVDSRRLVRQRVASSVTRLEVRENGLFGTLFLPETKKPVGAVIVLGGSGGGLSEGRPALLASHGLAALALAYFHEEGLPDEMVEIPLEYFETALDFLGAQEAVDAERIAVEGGSRGGELALLLGATFPRIRAVVAYVPSSVVYGGCCSPATQTRPAWTYEGEPLVPLASDEEDPELQAVRTDLWLKMMTGQPVSFTDSFRLGVEKATNLDVATIPVERISGPVIFVTGKLDELWPSAEFAEMAMDRLRELGFPRRFEHWSYENAGHWFRGPFLPNTVSESSHPLSPVVMRLGGTPKGNAEAASDSWPRVLAFYREVLSGGAGQEKRAEAMKARAAEIRALLTDTP